MGNTPCLTGIQVLPQSMGNVSRDSYAAFPGKLEINECQRIKTTRREGETKQGRRKEEEFCNYTCNSKAWGF